MAKQLNVNLAFTADTSKAKAQLQDLQHSLDNLIKGSANSAELPLTKELMEAQSAAASLKVALDSAINAQTGKLDITKFSGAMKTAGLDATTLRKHLENLGPAGNQAFLTLTKSVMSAEMPIRRTNALITEMWTTLKNTARWQISSSILHGFMGTVQSAYGYAQDLNESLNNIRIVTGQNVEEMSRFADRANKAAKALSTTTTEYTNASLIYYQQGLSDSEVEARTNITIKMANAAGVSAEKASDQLTAVWNNFYDGSKSLEYYADVMTALGAATASSTDEISQGLQKFAAVAETVGLSYEYATSALATVTATTRESADVVGTAFKTLFARIQGLTLGETLEDGTDLNKYSEALAKVGIDIKDTNGQMKDMDTILDELGTKWQTLGKDQQTALAQTVAGVRQYTQLVALMDNWDYFQENLDVASGAEGALQEQADIYAESWEAARDRVKAAAEDLYDSILDEDFFIGLLNGFEKAINLVTTLVDSVGGLPGVLAVVSTLVTKIFSKQLETSIDNMIYGINSLTGTNLKNSKATKEEYAKEAKKISFNDASSEGEAIGTGLQQQTMLQEELMANEAQLSEQEKARVQVLMDIHQKYVDQAAAIGKAADQARQLVQEQNKEARQQAKRSSGKVDTKEFANARKQMTALIKTGRRAQQTIGDFAKELKKGTGVDQYSKRIQTLQNRLNAIGKDSGSAKEFKSLSDAFKQGKIDSVQFAQGLERLVDSNEILDDAVIAGSDAVQKLGNGQVYTTQQTDAMANAELDLQNKTASANNALNAQTQQANNVKMAIAGAKGAMDSLATSIVGVMQGISQIGMGITSFVSIIDTLNNEDMSFGEKLLSITMSLSMAIPALVAGYKALTAAKWADMAASAKQLLVEGGHLATIFLQKLGLGGLVGAKAADTAATVAETSATGASTAANWAWQASAWPILVVTLLIVAAIGTLIAIAYVLVSAVEAISNAYNADAIAAEKAEASAKALAEAYDEAKQAYEDMVSAMDEYQSARDGLDSLTEGTQEYQDALEKANRAALELINKNPDLFKQGDYEWQNGELIINDDAMARARQIASSRESQAYAAMQMGQAEAREARNTADETALRRELIKDSTTGKDYLAGALTGAFSTAAFGTILATAIGGPLGLAIGGALMGTGGLLKGAVGGAAMTGSLESKKLEDSGALNKTLEQLKKDSSFLDSGAENIKATLNIDDDDIINALMENKDALLELSQAQEAQAQQEKLAAQQSAMEIMQKHGYDDADEMAYTAGAVFQKANDAAYEQMLKTMSSKGGLKAGAASYFDSQGISSKDGFKVEKYDAKNGTVKYSYLDEQGQRQEMEVTAEQIAMTQAVVAAEAELLDKCKTISGAFDALDADIKQVGSSTATLSEGMKAFLSSGDTSQLTKEQYDAMAGMSSDEMKNYLASIGINDTSAQDLGYDDVAALIADMDLANTGDKWAEYQNITAHQGTENLTLDQAENINNALKDVADFFGEEVGHEMLDLSAAMADSLDDAAQDDFWQQLGNISDYTDADQWDAFLEAMKESEDMTDEQIKALEDYVDTAKLAARATKDLNFDEMAESVRSLRDIMKNISEGNREISDEEFATLEAQGIDTSKFAKTIDGYRYLGDSADLVADISEGITNQFKEAEQNFANIAATAQQASQNLIDAEAELAAAKAAGDRTRASAEAGAQNQMSNTEKLSVIMSNIVTNVVSKIKTAWDWICGVMMDVYDFFVNVFNTIGQGITDVWNGFLQAISDIINGSIGAIMEWIEDTFDIDTGWDDIEFDKAEFTAAKTTAEVEAEENAKKAEEDLIASTQALADAIPDMVASIESSADYLSEAELEAGRAAAEQNYNTAMADYDAAVATYGADSTQAKYYEQLVAYYEAQMDAYAKALDSKAWGEVIAEGIDTKEMESYIDLLEQAHPEMRKLYKTTEDYENALLQVATANKKMEKGVKSLSSNWDDWNDIMSDSEASASDIATILPDVNDALQDVLNLDTEEFAMLPPDFAQKHWDLIQDVVNGVEGSVDTLRNMAGQEILMQIDGVVDPDGNIDAQFLALHEKIASFDQSQFTVGVAIDHNAHADFIAACNDIIQKAGMTAEQAQTYFASMGYDVKLKPVKQKVTETQWNHVYRNLYDEKGNPAGRVIQRAWPSTFEGEVDALAIETITPNGSYGGGIGVETTAPKTSRSTANQSGGGGGSNHDPETAEKRDTTKKSDTVERYREVSDAIDNVTDALTRAERATDRLWGKDKLNAMREENKILEKQRQLLLDKAKQAEKYAKEDAANLRKVAGDIGVSVVIDQETGDITNIEDVEETLHNRLAAAEETYNKKVDAYNKAVAKAKADGKVTDKENEELERMKEALDAYEEDTIGGIEDDIAAWEDAEQQFQESIETWEDAGLEAEEILDQIMQNNYDIIMEGLEIPLSLNEEDLRYVDLQLSRLEDDVYQMAESMALSISKLGEYQDNLRLADEALAELNRQHEAGEITDAAYQEGLNEIKDTYYDNIEALMELDAQMKNYYSDTLEAANEELSKYTSQMEHQTSVLEHYQSLLDLMGKSNDYKMMGKILEGQAKTTENQAKVSKQWYESRRQDADTLRQQYEDAKNSGASAEELEILKKNWQDAEAAANEAQEQMLSDAEAWAEALRAVLENKLSEVGQALENSLTGEWGSFDQMTTAMERANSLQEEYLTTTNQIYETNKLMRTAQQEIDKTTNSAAKKRLKAYIEETQELQNQSKLSQYELDIQKAKYELLLAEMALEDAQDAKSTVRLQRDSEGNFGYVYTADQNKLAEAQQQLEDAQNSLYNIGLEGANGYTEKYQQTMNEMYDTLTDLQSQYLDGAFESEEEYHAAMEAAKEYYYQKLQDYSALYQVALTTDSRVIKDAWSTDFADMTYNTEQWMTSVDSYTDEVTKAFRDWQNAITAEDGVASIIGNSLEDVAGNVQDITDKSDELAKTTKEEVIPALDDEIDSVATLTGEYAKLRDTIQEIITKYGLMISTINNNQQNEYNSQDDDNDDDDNEGNDGGTEGNEGDNGDDTDPPTTDPSNDPTEGNTPSAAISKGDIVKVKSNVTHFSKKSSNQPMQSWVPGASFEVFQLSGDEVLIGDRKRSGIYTGWVNKTDLEGFDTGGYTGEWGSYGKMAMLHEKELVLNPHDTENFLASMEILESILAMIDLQSTNAQLGGLLSSPGFISHGGSAIEQNVHIEASFPGVSDRNEIEEAFNNLINKASQYANRK